MKNATAFEMAEKIVRTMQRLIFRRFPHLNLIFHNIKIVENKTSNGNMSAMMTDGAAIWLIPDSVIREYQKSPMALKENLIHIFLHLYLEHPYHTKGKDPKVYDQKADEEVQRLMERILSCPCLRGRYDDHRLWYRREKNGQEGNEQEKKDKGDTKKDRAGTSLTHQEREEIEQMRDKIQQMKQMMGIPGTGQEIKELEDMPGGKGKESTLSYRELLKEYMRVSEKCVEEDREIDYIWYHYGMEIYGDIPIVEAPEIIEDPLHGQMVITIDISGSCKGDPAVQFLKETLKMIEELTDGSHKMQIRVFLADTVIQQEFVIESPEDIPSKEKFRFSGGGTDFQCVFDRIDRLVEDGEMDEPKCLIFFTDGYAWFPDQAPDYDTICAFVNQCNYQSAPIPEWIKKVLVKYEEE